MAASEGMIGYRSSLLSLTSGSGILTSIFDHYGAAKKGEIAKRQNGVMYSMTAGKTLAYGLFNLQNRGRMFVGHGLDVYKGQIVGLHARDNDLPVNPTKAKQLNNIRAAGTDENLILTPHIVHTLEQALELYLIYIGRCGRATPLRPRGPPTYSKNRALIDTVTIYNR